MTNLRKFVLKLFPIIQSDVFAENHIIDVDGKAHERIYPDDLLYEGYLEGFCLLFCNKTAHD